MSAPYLDFLPGSHPSFTLPGLESSSTRIPALASERAVLKVQV